MGDPSPTGFGRVVIMLIIKMRLLLGISLNDVSFSTKKKKMPARKKKRKGLNPGKKGTVQGGNGKKLLLNPENRK